jgi:hypothetical protein
MYDDKYLYFGFKCFDSEPGRIAAQLTERDSDLMSDDAVVVVLDTFHDRRSAYYFMTNALGTQTDGRIGENGKVVDNTWDAPWSSTALRTETGWTAELAIPFASLRFSAGGSRTWGLNVGRTVRRLLETSFWTGPLQDRFRISQAGTLAGLDLESAEQKYRDPCRSRDPELHKGPVVKALLSDQFINRPEKSPGSVCVEV